MTRLAAAGAAVTVLCGAWLAGAQEPRRVPGRWAQPLPIGTYELAGQPVRSVGDLPTTPAQTKELQALVDRIEHIFRGHQALSSPPPGYEIRLSASVSYRDKDNRRTRVGNPLPVDVSIGFYELLQACEACPVIRAPEPAGWLRIAVNDLEAAMDRADLRPQTPSDPEWWVLPRVVGREGRIDVHEGGFGRFILTAHPRPLGRPVTQAAVLDRVLRSTGADVRAAQQATDREPEEQRRALDEMEAAAREMARTNPSAANEIRQQLEQVRSALAASAAARQNEAREGARTGGDFVDQIRREAASLSPDQRQAAALVFTGQPDAYDDTRILTEQATADGADLQPRVGGLARSEASGRRVVVPNPGFFDPSWPSTRPQLLVIETGQPGDPSGADGSDPRIFELRQSLHRHMDWPALEALLKR